MLIKKGIQDKSSYIARQIPACRDDKIPVLQWWIVIIWLNQENLCKYAGLKWFSHFFRNYLKKIQNTYWQDQEKGLVFRKISN